jgi:hypothetical protein
MATAEEQGWLEQLGELWRERTELRQHIKRSYPRLGELLDHVVPTPGFEPGSTGWATTSAGRKHGTWAHDNSEADRPLGFWFVDVDGDFVWASLSHVRDFVPDVVLTPELVDELVVTISQYRKLERGAQAVAMVREWAVRHGVGGEPA